MRFFVVAFAFVLSGPAWAQDAPAPEEHEQAETILSALDAMAGEEPAIIASGSAGATRSEIIVRVQSANGEAEIAMNRVLAALDQAALESCLEGEPERWNASYDVILNEDRSVRRVRRARVNGERPPNSPAVACVRRLLRTSGVYFRNVGNSPRIDVSRFVSGVLARPGGLGSHRAPRGSLGSSVGMSSRMRGPTRTGSVRAGSRATIGYHSPS